MNEYELRKKVRDPKFMEKRWEDRARASVAEYEKKKGSLTQEERKIKEGQIKAFYDKSKEYRRKI